jgi:hypothetical protein
MVQPRSVSDQYPAVGALVRRLLIADVTADVKPMIIDRRLLEDHGVSWIRVRWRFSTDGESRHDHEPNTTA